MSTPNEPWDDPRITAYVMDDLIPTETAQFEAEMQQQPPLANAVDEARRVTEKLAGFYAAMPTMTLDEARRERIFGASITTRKGSSADLGYSGRRIAIWAIAASVLFIAIALPLWQMRETRTASNPISERTPSQVRNITESQPDLVKPTAAEPDGDARVSSMLDVADDREDTDAPQSRSATEEKAQSAAEMLILQLRYKQPQGTTSDLMTRVLDDSQTPFDEVDGDFRFATSVAAFGMLLRKSPLAGSWTYNDVVRVAEDSIGSDAHGVRSEFVGLVKIAESLTVSD